MMFVNLPLEGTGRVSSRHLWFCIFWSMVGVSVSKSSNLFFIKNSNRQDSAWNYDHRWKCIFFRVTVSAVVGLSYSTCILICECRTHRSMWIESLEKIFFTSWQWLRFRARVLSILELIASLGLLAIHHGRSSTSNVNDPARKSLFKRAFSSWIQLAQYLIYMAIKGQA